MEIAILAPTIAAGLPYNACCNPNMRVVRGSALKSRESNLYFSIVVFNMSTPIMDFLTICVIQ